MVVNKMKIEIANIKDVPELLKLHDKAFFAIAAEVDWLDAPGLKESLEQAREDFPKYMTLKMLSDDGKILFREIQRRLPHNCAWLFTCGEVRRIVSFYEREGFRTFNTERFENGHTWISMDKIICAETEL